MFRKNLIVSIVFVLLLLQSSLCFASWFDGVPQEGLDWLDYHARRPGDYWHPKTISKTFGDFAVSINFYDDEFEGTAYWVKITDNSTGQFVSGVGKTFSSGSAILSEISGATSLEDLLAAQAAAAAAAEAARVVSLPFTTGVADENKAPLISSETPVASADRTGLRMVENVIVPKTRTKTEQKRAEELAADGKPKLIGGSISYEDFEYFNTNGSTFEVLAGVEKDTENFTLGVIVPLSYVDITGGNWTKLGATGYLKKDFSGENIDSSLGFNVVIEQTWMSFSGIENSFAYGAGPMGSLAFDLQNIEVSLGANILFMGNSEYDTVTILTTALNVGIPLGDNFVLNAYTYRNDNFDSDNDYWVIGGTGTFLVSDVFGINVGLNTVTGHDNYDSITYYLGGSWKY
ncbi:MAG: hypothetical protein KAI43_13110 [Candidatus Aureabacteria bacterium]|nr:hypothetical protein [Candidatus Auribacterota bacterium]